MTLPFKVSGRLSNLSKFSINFDNEEQYNNFIKSIKDEVVKEIEPEKRKKYPDNNWTVFRRELQKDVAERQNKEDRKNGKTSIASYSDYYPFLKEAFKDRKSTRLNSSHVSNSYAVFYLKEKIIRCRF